jgi:hypothetical protein
MRATPQGTFVGDARAAGLPDLILFHSDPPRLIFAELKGTGGKLSDKQREFLQAAREVAREAFEPRNTTSSAYWPAPLGVYAWYPEDEETVEQILRSRVLA